jgi:predicted Rdx family selenoprotein
MAKVNIDIEYCVPCGYQNLAAWTVSEMFAAAGTDAAIGLTPGDAGVYTIKVDGETWFDKATNDGKTPQIHQMKDLKAKLRNYVEDLAATPVS